MTTASAASGPPESPVPGAGPAQQRPAVPDAPLAPEPGPVRRLRLRPGVAVTPLLAGLHLRGRGVAVTLEGSRALPALWRLLSDRLGADPPAADPFAADPLAAVERAVPGDGGARADAGAGAGTRTEGAASDQAGHRVEAALTTLTARLREHDLLVEHPDGAELPPWPGSSAAHPAQAVEAIRAARPVVAAADPRGPLAVSLVGALRRSGAVPRVTTDVRLPPDQTVITADVPSGAVALAVSCTADGGFVTEPGPPRLVRSDAATLAGRLATDDSTTTGAAPGTPSGAAATRSRPAAPGPNPSGTAVGPGATQRTAATGGPSRTHAALLAGAAAGRLLAAVAGLPDPAGPENASRTTGARHPAVLIARVDPPTATYHPWAAAPRAGRRRPDAPPAQDLGEALRRVTDLGDPRLGVLDAPLPADLPQLPASLVSCRTPAGLLVAGAVRTDLARLEAACRAAELALDDGSSVPAVGAGPDHALGRALRRAVLGGIEGETALPAKGDPAAADARGGAAGNACVGAAGNACVGAAGNACADGCADGCADAYADACADAAGDDAWRTHPQARHWWTVLTERMGRPAELSVRRLGPGGAHLAVVRVRPASSGTGAGPGTVSRAVEATAADAVALAALDAVTRVMAAEHVPGPVRHTALTGAVAPLAASGAEPADWADEGWTDTWLAGIAAREPALRAALYRLTGLRPAPWRGTGRPSLAEALRASGFTILTGGPR
ncbi:hypothetical protein KBP30_01605 [Streptomyces sp. Go40/10]|uniref:hypothetical protein n=1 Tax=Streptomyces sp. Go40/10 TaxID=2825844 RepID=UPI001E544FF3|nr:hypothetical protein [Streptomyces sp. Go40/10]UFQ99975.1 hypothetical protein KBP30_01605 [Streptomyces sp. Go40/10]